ncbi:MAG: tRNA preQ1(34) S-adenosylmethionine ribosyltransferase-isomerase QueA [bacterium]|jgi:S-adenosylmethionine:tRNA ribosyltransferase-isomerase
MKLADFDYCLPEELIAQEPIEPRDHSRLLVLHRRSGEREEDRFYNLPRYLEPGDTLVLNDTRVIPARLYGVRGDTGGRLEVVLLRRREEDIWEVLVKPGRRAKIGTEILFGEGALTGEVIANTDFGGRLLRFSYSGIFEQVLRRLGEMPLPPYIHRKLADPERYQTVYAARSGSAAAPTAGLHFTDRLLERIASRQINLVYLTLHVGLGTFRPVKTENIEEHAMHAEYYDISEATAAAINRTREAGRRIIAVGTTSVRTLETSADSAGRVRAGRGWTDIFIYPGYRYKTIDGLITNFHLPKSTLLMLVSAFAGRENILAAYREAVEKRFRFFSFGDAMFII